jgi:hypothetical protein
MRSLPRNQALTAQPEGPTSVAIAASVLLLVRLSAALLPLLETPRFTGSGHGP